MVGIRGVIQVGMGELILVDNWEGMVDMEEYLVDTWEVVYWGDTLKAVPWVDT